MKGFTVKELVMVLVVISILCLASIPQFYVMRKSHRQAEFNQTIEKIELSLNDAMKSTTDSLGKDLVAALDTEVAGQSCMACFTIAFEKGLKNDLWYKVSNNEYYYALTNTPSTLDEFRAKGNLKLQFDQTQQKIFTQEIR